MKYEYSPDRERRARRNVWLCAFLFFLLLIGACSFLTISGHAATFYLGKEEQPVNWVEVSPGVWKATLLNAETTATSAALLTVDQNEGLGSWQQTADLFFYRVQSGVYEFLKIADANAVTPVATGNELRWTALWTLPGGTADYIIRVLDWHIYKEVVFSSVAGACLPSPTSAAFFPGAPESELGFAIGSDPFAGERSVGVTGEMDGVPIDLDDDQVVGSSMTLRWNGAFLHSFPPAYCEGMDGQGQQIYLGDLQCHFSAWSWAQAKTASWFDPSYSFQGTTYIDDTHIGQGAGDTNYDTSTVMLIRPSSDSQGGIQLITIHVPEIAAAYGITASSSGINALRSFQLKLTSNASAGTVGNLHVGRSAYVSNTADATWNNTINSPTQHLFIYPAAAWSYVAGTTITLSTDTTAADTLLQWARACIAAGTDFQLRLNPGWGGTSSDYVQIRTVDNADAGSQPVLVLEIDPNITVTDLAYPGSIFYLADRKIGAASLTVSASITNANVPQPTSIVLSASGWMEDRTDRVSISSSVNAVSSADATITGASPVYAWYIKPVTYSNLCVTLNNGGASVVYYASNPLDVWTPQSAIHKGSAAQVLASSYSIMTGNWMEYYAYDGADKIRCGTSSTTENDDYGIVEVALPAAQQDNSIHLGVENHLLASVSKTIFTLDFGGGSSGSSLTAAEVDQAIAHRLTAVTASIYAASQSLTTLGTTNNVLLNENDRRLREIQSDTAAGGRVIPASGIASLNVNLQMTQENAWDGTVFGLSGTNNEPNLGMWITHGKTPTTAFTYKLATLGNSITYIGAWDSKVDAAAIGGASVYIHAYTFHLTPADATGVYHIAGVCSDGTKAWPIGGDFVYAATPTLQIVDQLTATAFDARADQWDTMLDNAAAGEIVAATVWRANALITRTTAGVNIDDATDSVYVPLDGDYGQERDYRKADGTIHTIRMLADHDEATTDKKTSKYRVLGPGYTIQTWAAAQGHSISASARTTP